MVTKETGQTKLAVKNKKQAQKFLLEQQRTEQVRRQYKRQQDRTEDNLRRLNALSRNRVSKDTTTSIVKRAKRSKEEPEIVKPEEGTVFTEEDFVMFEREYVVD
ncbi:hypothetical protein J6590_056036 [Homalodisca vitripennis]|nr:hypothetical protein J6590_056036 [Homalodisca vitripennis]